MGSWLEVTNNTEVIDEQNKNEAQYYKPILNTYNCMLKTELLLWFGLIVL